VVTPLNRGTFAGSDEGRSSVRIRLLVLAASPALAIAGTASTATATKLLGSIGPASRR
jgi:hypothetical protein